MKLEALASLNFNDKTYEHYMDFETCSSYLIQDKTILAEIDSKGHLAIYTPERTVYGYIYKYTDIYAFQRIKGDDKLFTTGHKDLDVFERALFNKLLRERVICS